MFYLIFFSNSSIGQEYFLLKGQIVDAKTRTPLENATIYLSNSKLATISDYRGNFSFKINEELFTEKIYISYLGYQSISINVREGINKFLYIKLSVLPYALNSIRIRYYKPQQLILEALKNIPTNYYKKSTLLEAYYREEVKENNEPIQSIEAILEIYKGSYADRKDHDHIRLVQGREHEGLKNSVFFNYLYFVNGPYEVLTLDIAKNPSHFISVLQNSVNFLNPKHFKYYDYQLIENYSYAKEHEANKIIFKPKKRKAILEGYLIVDKNTLAILEISFKVSKNRLSKAILIDSMNEKFLHKQGIYTEAVDFNCRAN